MAGQAMLPHPNPNFLGSVLFSGEPDRRKTRDTRRARTRRRDIRYDDPKMRRVRNRPVGRLPLLGAVIVAVLLVAFTAMPADAGDGASFRSGSARAEVRAHEKARVRVERLRKKGAQVRKVRSAERSCFAKIGR